MIWAAETVDWCFKPVSLGQIALLVSAQLTWMSGVSGRWGDLAWPGLGSVGSLSCAPCAYSPAGQLRRNGMCGNARALSLASSVLCVNVPQTLGGQSPESQMG